MLRVGTDCSGIEAPLHALSQLGIEYEHVFSSEICKRARKYIVANHAPQILYGDITQRDVASVPPVDLYICGVACQPFSKMNAAKYDDDPRRSLWHYVLEYVRTKRPKAFVFENVRTFYFSSMYTAIAAELDKLEGYHWSARLLDAKDYGVPQSRNRLFIVGTQRQGFEWPTPIPLEVSCMDLIDEVAGAPDEIPPYYRRTLDTWGITDAHRGIVCMSATGFKCGHRQLGTAEREKVLRTDVSPCLLAHRPGHVVAHLNRYLTGTECLRLQGFDPDLVTVPAVTAMQFRTLAGNSMCAQVVKNLLINVLKLVNHK